MTGYARILRGTVAGLATAALLTMMGGALAADKAAKTYRWVDKDGVVHFGDHIPPEYASSQNQVLNESGVPVANQDGARTAEQIAADKAAAEKALLAARADKVLLDTYLSVDEIEALRDRRLELIDTQITVTENYLQGLRDILQRLQAEASAFKPYSADPMAPPIDERLAKELSNTMDSVMLYERNLADNKARKADVMGRFANDIDRFKVLKADPPKP